MHAGKKKCEKIKIFWKNINLIFEFLTQFFENLTQKTLKSEKKSNFRKSDFWCQKSASRAKITTGWYFFDQKSKKKPLFLKFWK